MQMAHSCVDLWQDGPHGEAARAEEALQAHEYQLQQRRHHDEPTHGAVRAYVVENEYVVRERVLLQHEQVERHVEAAEHEQYDRGHAERIALAAPRVEQDLRDPAQEAEVVTVKQREPLLRGLPPLANLNRVVRAPNQDQKVVVHHDQQKHLDKEHEAQDEEAVHEGNTVEDQHEDLKYLLERQHAERDDAQALSLRPFVCAPQLRAEQKDLQQRLDDECRRETVHERIAVEGVAFLAAKGDGNAAVGRFQSALYCIHQFIGAYRVHCVRRRIWQQGGVSGGDWRHFSHTECWLRSVCVPGVENVHSRIVGLGNVLIVLQHVALYASDIIAFQLMQRDLLPMG
ncbi:adhesion and penetration protein autotransporter precursor [Babesia caballi]|uniref:Adhesion and penetration protein autotransporter n=1 Tax=Babesia caballi TaxID=5871 RepID=A0AAV4LPH1_BABCB|nr:adhesion and penetration protein autotransporter precursor [Babesia caballi]